MGGLDCALAKRGRMVECSGCVEVMLDGGLRSLTRLGGGDIGGLGRGPVKGKKVACCGRLEVRREGLDGGLSS